MASLSSFLLRAASPSSAKDRAEPKASAAEAEFAPGRLPHAEPVAIIDIGSNSVRLVVYERLSRALTPIFNEKSMCGLGKSVASSGRLADEAVEQALKALRRFRKLADQMEVSEIRVIATAAARDAANGPEFVAAAEAICRAPVDVISGEREARLAALGVVSGVWKPDGVVGDLGGGSLELTSVRGSEIGEGISLPLGGLRLRDAAGKSLKKAEKLTKEALEAARLSFAPVRNFYAVGGTWRALARVHMAQRAYPLHVMHGYTVPARDFVDFARIVQRADADSLDGIETVAGERRPLLSYGAMVAEQVLRILKPEMVVLSALGVREGLLYEQLPAELQAEDPLLVAAQELGLLRSRSPRHGVELIAWTDELFSFIDPDESEDERRLRHAGCYLADIGWRAHPDYRGEQSLSVIAHAAFVGIDHPGRGFLGLASYFRHSGMDDDLLSPKIRELIGSRSFQRARLLGAALRVAYLVSASMPGILPEVPIRVEEGRLVLDLQASGRGELASDRVTNRLRTLAKLVGLQPECLV